NQITQSPTAQFANRFTKYFIALVLALSILGFYLGLKTDTSRAFETFLAVLVVTCPCALSLATPTALTVAMTSMAKKGFLVVKQHVCDSLTQIQDIIFDKTGTLTENRITISEVVVKHANKKKILSIAKSLEQLANHP